jgi:nucleotide-binding universal stress UspA family protein
MSGLIDKILLPLDGTETANQALPIAQQLAQQAGAELILFRVIPDFPMEVKVKGTIGRYELDTKKQQAAMEHATQWLERQAEGLRIQRVLASAMIDVGDPAERILHYAQEDDVDLIIMSTHGRRGVPRMIHGSVSAKILTDAPCPVVVVPAQVAHEVEDASEVLAPSR